MLESIRHNLVHGRIGLEEHPPRHQRHDELHVAHHLGNARACERCVILGCRRLRGKPVHDAVLLSQQEPRNPVEQLRLVIGMRNHEYPRRPQGLATLPYTMADLLGHPVHGNPLVVGCWCVHSSARTHPSSILPERNHHARL